MARSGVGDGISISGVSRTTLLRRFGASVITAGRTVSSAAVSGIVSEFIVLTESEPGAVVVVSRANIPGPFGLR